MRIYRNIKVLLHIKDQVKNSNIKIFFNNTMTFTFYKKKKVHLYYKEKGC